MRSKPKRTLTPNDTNNSNAARSNSKTSSNDPRAGPCGAAAEAAFTDGQRRGIDAVGDELLAAAART